MKKFRLDFKGYYNESYGFEEIKAENIVEATKIGKKYAKELGEYYHLAHVTQLTSDSRIKEKSS